MSGAEGGTIEDIAPIEEFLGRSLRGRNVLVFFTGVSQESMAMKQIVEGILERKYSIKLDVDYYKIEVYGKDMHAANRAKKLCAEYGKEIKSTAPPLIVAFDASGKKVVAASFATLSKPYQKAVEEIFERLRKK